jgi:hypothetical protein
MLHVRVSDECVLVRGRVEKGWEIKQDVTLSIHRHKHKRVSRLGESLTQDHV